MTWISVVHAYMSQSNFYILALTSVLDKFQISCLTFVIQHGDRDIVVISCGFCSKEGKEKEWIKTTPAPGLQNDRAIRSDSFAVFQ